MDNPGARAWLMAQRRLRETERAEEPAAAVWVCPVCSHRVTAETQAKLRGRRGAHMAKHSAEERRLITSRLFCSWKGIVASSDLPEEERAWQCPLCPKALPIMACASRLSLKKSTKAHRESDHPDVSPAEWRKALLRRSLGEWQSGSLREERIKRSRVAMHSALEEEVRRCGHDPRRVEPWTLTKGVGVGAERFTLWCGKCWAHLKTATARARPCPGRPEKTCGQQVLWKRLAGTDHATRLAEALGCTEEELAAHWGVAVEREFGQSQDGESSARGGAGEPARRPESPGARTHRAKRAKRVRDARKSPFGFVRPRLHVVFSFSVTETSRDVAREGKVSRARSRRAGRAAAESRRAFSKDD